MRAKATTPTNRRRGCQPPPLDLGRSSTFCGMPTKPRRRASLGRSGRSLPEWAERRRIDIDAPRALHAIVIWSRFHGFVSLEIGGNFQGMGIDAETLFELVVAVMAP